MRNIASEKQIMATNQNNSPLSWIPDELRKLESKQLRRHLGERTSPQRAEVEFRGRRCVNFSANDYLGLSNDPRVLSAAQESLAQVGWGSGASPLVTGRSMLHAELEKKIAATKQTEAALLFPTGYAANVGAITTLVGKGDLILSDAKNHASIIDGCRLSGATVYVYRHRDVDDVRRGLSKSKTFGRILIVTDGLFSMDGDIAPLKELVPLAHQFNAMLMVDEAHSMGVFGSHGRGVCELQDVESNVQIRVGTLSKAIGSIGGFVAGSSELINLLSNRARPFVFSTAAPAATCAAALKAFEIIESEPLRRVELLANAKKLRQRLTKDNWPIGHSESQIVPVIVGDADKTMKMSNALLSRGFLVPGIRPPSVPEGESLLRISLSYHHSWPTIERLVDTLNEIRDASN